MSAKRDARRKLAAATVREYVRQGLTDPCVFDNRLTKDLTDKQFDRLVKEIRKAKVVVKWGAR